MPATQVKDADAKRDIAKDLAIELIRRSGVQSLDTPDATNLIAQRAVEMARYIVEST